MVFTPMDDHCGPSDRSAMLALGHFFKEPFVATFGELFQLAIKESGLDRQFQPPVSALDIRAK